MNVLTTSKEHAPHLGWGVFLAWIFCMFYTDVADRTLGTGRLRDSSDPIISLITMLLPVVSAVAMLWMLVFSESHTVEIEGHASWVWTGAIVCSLGSFALTFSSYLQSSLGLWLYAAGSVVTGAGSSLLWIAWGCRYARLAQEAVEVVAPTSALFAGLLILASSAMQSWIGLAFIGSFPLVSCALWSMSRESGIDAESKEENCVDRYVAPLSSLRMLGRSAYGVCTACLFVSVLGSITKQTTQLETQSAVIASVIVMGVVGFFSLRGPRRISVSFAFRWLCPLVVAGFASYCVLPDQIASSIAFSISIAARFAFCTITQIFFARVAAQRNMTATQAFGWGWICVHGGDMLGVIITLCVGFTAQGITSNVLAGICIVLLVAATMYVIGDRASLAHAAVSSPRDRVCSEASAGAMSHETAFCSAHTKREPSSIESVQKNSPERTYDQASSQEESLARLETSIGLTPREIEVFRLLIKGRSVPYIRDELVISRDTVATHVKHIYAKAQVHSRQELLDLVEVYKQRGEK